MHTLEKRHTCEKEIKKSRFIAVAVPVTTPEQALAQLESLRDKSANHNCWAYKVGDQYRFSDDGEPGGTAGRPILAAIEGQKLDGVLVVVTRFFGGIKLGAGGLVRAYGGTAAQCLRDAPKREIIRKVALRLQASFEYTGAIYPLLERYEARKCHETYGETGFVIDLEIEERLAAAFEAAIRDATRGAATLVPI